VCVEKGDNWISVKTLNSHTMTHKRGVLIPGGIINLPAVCEKDKLDIKFAIKNNVEFIAASFIRKAC